MPALMTSLPKPVIKISCIIIAHNERDRIEWPIRSVQGLVDEILVIDSGSTDGTQEFATSLGAKVIFHPFDGFGPQKRFAEDQASHDIVLNLDADEWLSEPLRTELAVLLTQKSLPARSFKMRMTMVYPHRDRPCFMADYHNYVRLYDRRATRFSPSLVHDEVPPTPDAIQLKAPAYHRSFRSLSHMVRKEVTYYNLQAREKKKSPLQIVVRMPFEFIGQFLKFYFIRHHIFGGAYGLVFSLTIAFLRWLRLPIFLGW